METIIAAKESSKVGFDSFSSFNVTSPSVMPGGRFVGGVTSSFLTAGPDGVYGTCDDGRTGTFNPTCPGSLGTQVEVLVIDPGSDGKYSNTTTPGNDTTVPLLSFTRRVDIVDIVPPNPATKQINVTVTYPNVVGGRESVVLSTQISNFNILQ